MKSKVFHHMKIKKKKPTKKFLINYLNYFFKKISHNSLILN